MDCGKEGLRRPQIPKGVVFGLILIGLGAAFLLHNIYYIHIGKVLIYWPCALMVAGLVRIWNRGFFSVWGHILLVGGALLQLAQLQIYYGSFYFSFIEMWWPVLMIWIGLLITVKAFIPKRRRRRAEEPPPHAAQAAQDEWPMHDGEGPVRIAAGSEGSEADNGYTNNYGNYN
jgi:hypothetical protein